MVFHVHLVKILYKNPYTLYENTFSILNFRINETFQVFFKEFLIVLRIV